MWESIAYGVCAKIREQDPLKQGLKHKAAAIAKTAKKKFASKIH